MASLSKETVKVAAEAAGITGLAEDIAGALAPDVEYRLREILQEATRFQRHARRATLTTADINGMCSGGGTARIVHTALRLHVFYANQCGREKSAAPRRGEGRGGARRDAMA